MTCKTYLLSVLLAFGVAGSASAHAFLKKASPAVGSTVRTAPAELTIQFTEGVEPAFSSIMVTDSGGTRMESGSVHLSPGGDSTLAVGLKPLHAGAYVVTWHATSTDTHKTEGHFSFSVGP